MPDSKPHHLPDQLRLNLRLVFVGTAASTRSAELGHYYAHPGNRFWRAFHEAGGHAPALSAGRVRASTKSSSMPILMA